MDPTNTAPTTASDSDPLVNNNNNNSPSKMVARAVMDASSNNNSAEMDKKDARGRSDASLPPRKRARKDTADAEETVVAVATAAVSLHQREDEIKNGIEDVAARNATEREPAPPASFAAAAVAAAATSAPAVNVNSAVAAVTDQPLGTSGKAIEHSLNSLAKPSPATKVKADNSNNKSTTDVINPKPTKLAKTEGKANSLKKKIHSESEELDSDEDGAAGGGDGKDHSWRTHRGPPILTPHAHDVLMGRGKRFSDHSGNMRFREFIRQKKADYTLSWK